MRQIFHHLASTAVSIAAVVVASYSPTVLCQSDERIEFHIKAQDLGGSLQAVATATGREILFQAESVAGKTAPALDGRYSPGEALSILLNQSGLHFRENGRSFVILGRAEAAAALNDGADAANALFVTASRIRGAQATTPVISVSREDAARQGQNSLVHVVRSIPQNFTGGQSTGVVGSGQNGEDSNGSTAIDLRGLGADATLTLVNGHRMSSDSAFQGVDISAIPVIAIDRIEVVADGASALYGSDAVGGVANVILRRDYDGLLTSVGLGGATDGGLFRQQYGAVAGKRWSGGGFMIAGEYLHSTAVTADQRPFTSNLHPSAVLIAPQEQFSAVVAGHKQLTENLRFELDGNFNVRTSYQAEPYSTTADVREYGGLSNRKARSYSITPRLLADLPGDWHLNVTGTHARSLTSAQFFVYVDSLEYYRTLVHYNYTMDAAEAGIEGPLFALPGGEARLAAGLGYRELSLDAAITYVVGGVSDPLFDNSNSRKTRFAYGELSLPVIGAANRVPLIRELTLNGAIRWESIKNTGDVATPKFGLIYKPVSDIAIKASWGRSFKAPALNVENRAPSAGLLPGDYYTPTSPGRLPVLTIRGVGKLRPEKARTWTTSIAATPSFLPGARFEVSYFNIRYRDRVVDPVEVDSAVFGSDIFTDYLTLFPTVDQVNAALVGITSPINNRTGQPFDPAAIGAILDARTRNAAIQSAQGIDFAASYSHNIDKDDRVNLSLAASYLESQQVLSKGQPVQQLAGTIFHPPHWRGRATAAWEHANLTLSGAVNYIGGTLDNRYEPFVRAGSFTSADLVAGFRSPTKHGPFAGLDITFAALNLFNAKPAIIRNRYAAAAPYDSANQPSSGRTLSITINKAW